MSDYTRRCEEEWYQLAGMIGCVLATGLLADEAPVNMLVIADPGTGKSSLFSKFYKCDSVRVLADATSDSIRHVVIPEALHKGHRHLIFPEFYKLFQRSQGSVDNLAGTLSALMWGEMKEVMQGERKMESVPDGFAMGILAAMTTEVWKKWQHSLGATGLKDRFLCVHLRMTRPLQEYILSKVAMGDKSMLTKFPWHFKDGERYEVKIPESMGRYFEQMIMNVPMGKSPRFVSQMRTMLKALTLMHNEYVVTERRVEGLYQMALYIDTSKTLEFR